MADNDLILTVKRAQQGDPHAYDVLVRRYQNMAVAYARNLLRNSAAAEDAAQEAFVQAWCDLPKLMEAAAFGSWLRSIVFKYCDRDRRSARPTLLLDETMYLPDYLGPAQIVERADDAATVRAAIDALPCSLREVTLLYYLAGHNTKDIAAFLELPLSTVKNRLHASRKKLREELWTMAEIVLEQEKPSHNEAFAGNVLARVLQEFQRQEAEDCQNVDLNLLTEGRTALFEILCQQSPIDDQSLRNGFMLLWRKKDWQALSTLLMRCLGQSSSDSETAWAYLHLATAMAASGSPSGAVLAYEAFERWIPGKSPVLAVEWPHYPADSAGRAAAYESDEVHLLFLVGFAQFPMLYWNLNAGQNTESAEYMRSFTRAWYDAEYLKKVDDALTALPTTSRSQDLRFRVLQQAANSCATIDNREGVRNYISQMHALADRCAGTSISFRLKAQVLGQEIHLANRTNDKATFTERLCEMTTLLTRAAQQEGIGAPWIRGQRQALALVLMRANHHSQALELWEANDASGGPINSYGSISFAATIWKLTSDPERTAELLRKARAQEQMEVDLFPLFARCPEFANVLDDPKLLLALNSSSQV